MLIIDYFYGVLNIIVLTLIFLQILIFKMSKSFNVLKIYTSKCIMFIKQENSVIVITIFEKMSINFGSNLWFCLSKVCDRGARWIPSESNFLFDRQSIFQCSAPIDKTITISFNLTFSQIFDTKFFSKRLLKI